MKTTAKQASVESISKELHAYAKLLFLRVGRQYQDKTSYREFEDETQFLEPGNDSSSSKNIPLGITDVDRLRREFLDRLSETVSLMKGGRYVVASYMVYWPDTVKVFVAINSRFADGDALYTFLGNLCTALKGIAAVSDHQTKTHTDALWDMLIRHQSSRLNAVITELRQRMKDFPHLLPQQSSTEPVDVVRDDVLSDRDGVVLNFEDCLRRLVELLYGKCDSDGERHSRLVSLSYIIYRNFPAEDFQRLGRAGDKLRQEIGFLGRLETSFRVLVEAARQLSGFEDLSLITVVKSKKTQKKPTSSQDWTLVKTFQALHLELNDASVDKLMGPSSSRSKARWTKSKLLDHFSRLKSPKWEVHAEIQLIVYILSNQSQVAGGKEFDYIGCSRYSCLLCSQFLDSCGGLKTRGCHGKLYNHSWTLPLEEDMGDFERHMMSESAKEVISWMRNELIGRNTVVRSPRRKPEAKESTVGSLNTIPGTREGYHRRNYPIDEYLHRQRAQNLSSQYTRERLDLVEDDEASGAEPQHETHAEDTSKLCAGCSKVETTRVCSHCQGALFCSKTCEQEMPLSHLLKCNMRQVTSADYLYQDVVSDEIPTDPQVRQNFWFDRCTNKLEESHLLGLFQELLLFHPNPVTREKLPLWLSDPAGNPYLVARIVEKFGELPNNGRVGYFPWFLRHRARFELPEDDRSIPRPPSPTTHVKSMMAKARKYLAPEDQHKNVQDLYPFAKMHCFCFYSMVLNFEHPSPLNQKHDYWFDFGFVVAHDKHEEGGLGSMYSTMLFGSIFQEEYDRSLGGSTMMGSMDKSSPTCSFEELWRAWERGDLMTLFNKRSPDSQTRSTGLLPRLGVFLEAAKTTRPSIWKLHHFLALERVSVDSAVPEIARAARDYGFSEKLSTKTTMDLRHFYDELLRKAEPLEIHRERMKGNLVQFAERFVGIITPRVKEVLRDLQ